MESNDHYMKTIKYKNGLVETRIMKSEESHDGYYKGNVKVSTGNSLGKNKCKEEIRKWIAKMGDSIHNNLISVCYITNIGLHYVEPVIFNGDQRHPRDEKNKIDKLMSDPVKKHGPSDETNSAIIDQGTVVFGVVIQRMEIPKVKEVTRSQPKQAPKKPKFKPPTLEYPKWD